MKEELSFISTKLKIPVPRSNYIARQELYDKLSSLDRYKMIVINGAPGSGKTTLVTAFLKENPAIKKKTRWISFDEENNDLFSFWFYFIEAVKDHLGEQGENIVSVFHGLVQKQDIEQILIILINQLQYAGEITIVMDDFHHISDEYILETLTFFIKHSSDNVRLIILSREESKFYLGDLLISGRLLEIGEEDLRLSHEESLEFINKTLSINLDSDTANRMTALSEGWIGGLQLLALAMHQKQPDLLRNVKVLNNYMVEYLSNEILKSVDEDVKDFLIKTSILSHFDKKLCNIFLGIGNSGELIQTLLEKNIFIITIDEEAEVYRYHNIFREFLRFHFDLLQDEVRVELHLKAAMFYEEAGDLEDSIIHFLQISSYEKALENIQKMKHSVTAWHYLKRIPVKYINDNQDMLFQRLFYHFCNMEMDECNKIADQLKNKDDNLTYRVFRLIKSMVDDDGFEVGLGVELLQGIEEMNFSEATKAVMYLNIAILLCIQDKFTDGIKYLEKAMLLNQKVNNPYIEYFLLNYKSQIKEAMGDLEESKELYERVFKLIERCPFLEPLRGFSLLGLAGVYMHQLELSRTEEYLSRVEELLSNTYKSLERGYLYNLMELKALSGSKDEALSRCNELFKLEIYQNDIYISSLLRYQIFLKQVDQDRADEFMKICDGRQAGELRFDDKLTYAQLLSLRGEVKVPLEIIDSLLITARKDKIKLYFVKALLAKVCILAEHDDDKKKEILNLLREAIYYSYQNGIRSPYKLAGDQILKYLKLLMDDRGKDLMLKRIAFSMIFY